MMNWNTEGCMETEWAGLPAQKLFQAAYEGYDDDLRDLLTEEKYRKMVNTFDGDNFGILHCCAISGDDIFADEIVEVLVEAGIDINLQSPSTKETALQIATIYGKVRYVKALLDHGARCDITDWSGMSPIPTARGNCRCPRSRLGSDSDEKCCQVLELLLKAEEKVKSDKNLQQKADKLRNAGNKAFGKGKYEEAKGYYTQSIEILEDYRAYANRALCSIKLGQEMLKNEAINSYPIEVRRRGKEAISDARKAVTLEPTFVKAHYRRALGYAMAREFPRSKLNVNYGLKSCPGNEQLERLLKQLDALDVPDRISNAFCHEEYWNQLENGAEYLVCAYCMIHNPIPSIRDDCVFCAMPFRLYEPEREEEVRSFILNN